MTKAEANRKACELLGETAFAVRVQHKDRNQRFGIMLIDNGSAWCAGFGSSYESALLMAADEVAAARVAAAKSQEAIQNVKTEQPAVNVEK